jgi:hypothetical protein
MQTKQLFQFIAIAGLALYLGLPATVHAGTQLWTFTPLSSAKQVVNQNGKVEVKYKIVNQSMKTQTLVMKDMPGVTITPATCSLSAGASCEVTLEIEGSKLGPNGIIGGPIFCQQGNANLCYQPTASDALNISLSKPATQNNTQEATQAAIQVATDAAHSAAIDAATSAARNALGGSYNY